MGPFSQGGREVRGDVCVQIDPCLEIPLHSLPFTSDSLGLGSQFSFFFFWIWENRNSLHCDPPSVTGAQMRNHESFVTILHVTMFVLGDASEVIQVYFELVSSC